MNAEFRIIHFITDPFLGGRVPIAAIVRAKSEVRFIRAQHLPSAECLGGPAYAATLMMIIDDLAARPDFERLPPSVGPLVMMMEPRLVPAHVSDPDKWLCQHVLPAARDKAEHKTDVSRRASLGRGFLKKHQVDGYVRGRFRPRKHLSSLLSGQRAASMAVGVDTISHWVPGAHEHLLMEPLVLHRQNFEKDLHEIVQNFAVYRHFLDSETPDNKVSLVAYVLPSMNKERCGRAFGALHGMAHAIFDLARLEDEQAFIANIRRVGETGRTPVLRH